MRCSETFTFSSEMGKELLNYKMTELISYMFQMHFYFEISLP